MLISCEIENVYYSSVLGKNIEVEAHGTVIIGNYLIVTNGNHFSQELHVENLETSQEVRKAMELDKDFHKTILMQLITSAINQLEDCFVCDEYMKKK